MSFELVQCIVSASLMAGAPEDCGANGGSITEPVFESVGPIRGIGPYTAARGMTAGVAAADFDDDGDIDVFVPTAGGVPDQLYRNTGNGRFEEVAAQLGVDSLANSRAALWFDYDGDGRLDLVVGRDRFNTFGVCWIFEPIAAHASTLVLYRHGPGGVFQEVTASAGLDFNFVYYSKSHLGGICAGDVNRDGYPELCITQWGGEVTLLLNGGDGTFTDISISSNVGIVHDDYWQPMMHDFDGDGWTDIYVNRDFEANMLFLNQHDNTFVNVAPAANMDNAMNDMGTALGDYDNDGDFDVYITNITGEVSEQDMEHNVLLRNDTVNGDLAFTEVAQDCGVAWGFWGWGATFIDADNDGLLDLAATNGWCFPWPDDPSRFFWNQGGDPPTFLECSALAGFDSLDWGTSLIAFDANRDGRLDLMETCNLGGPLRLLENQPGIVGVGNTSIVVRPRSTDPNTRSIGAIVSLWIGAEQQTRLITAGTSSLGQEPAEAFFGVGTHAVADLIEIRWPDGSIRQLENVPTGGVLTTCKPCFSDTNDDAAVNVNDLLNVILGWNTDGTKLPEIGANADVTGDGIVQVDDLIRVLLAWGMCGSTGD